MSALRRPNRCAVPQPGPSSRAVSWAVRLPAARRGSALGCRRRQRGAAALIVTMVLFFAMLLVAGFANRGLVFEQRAATGQYRAAQAFEAAEAGLDWTLAQLANPAPLDADCRPSSDPSAQPLRERLLRWVAASSAHAPRTWLNGSVASPLQPACVRSAGGWTCACPAGGWPALAVPAPIAGTAQPAFTVQLSTTARPGVLTLLSTGCTALGGACRPGAPAAGDAPDATARVQVSIALVPGIATLPVAPLTLRDSLAVGTATIGLHNTDAASGGAVLHAGGGSDAVAARTTTLPGNTPATATLTGDATLHARSADGLFAGFFGVDKATWRGQAAVRRISCDSGGGNCGATLRAAIDGGAAAGASTHRVIWVDGDLPLAGSLALGSADRPVLIVASGTLRLRGAVAVHGLLYGAALTWNDTPAAGGAFLRGALVSEAGYSGNGEPDLFYDAAVLGRLRTDSGSFVRVPGSWRDFF